MLDLQHCSTSGSGAAMVPSPNGEVEAAWAALTPVERTCVQVCLWRHLGADPWYNKRAATHANGASALADPENSSSAHVPQPLYTDVFAERIVASVMPEDVRRDKVESGQLHDERIHMMAVSTALRTQHVRLPRFIDDYDTCVCAHKQVHEWRHAQRNVCLV